jgi:hypothetical protein
MTKKANAIVEEMVTGWNENYDAAPFYPMIL